MVTWEVERVSQGGRRLGELELGGLGQRDARGLVALKKAAGPRISQIVW
jgi:hypothetical protein